MNAKNIALASLVLATGCLDPGSRATVTMGPDGTAQVIVCDIHSVFDGCVASDLSVEHDGAVTQIPYVNNWQGSMVTLSPGSTNPFTISDGSSAVEIAMPTPLVVDPTTTTEFPAGSTVHLTWAPANDASQKMTWSYDYGCEYAPNEIEVGGNDETSLPDSGALDVSVDSVIAQAKQANPQVTSCVTTIWLNRKLESKTGGSFLSSAVGVSGLGVIVKMD